MVIQTLIPSTTSAATIFLILPSVYQIGNGKKTPSSYGVDDTQPKLGLHRENPPSITDFYHLQFPQIKSELFETYVPLPLLTVLFHQFLSPVRRKKKTNRAPFAVENRKKRSKKVLLYQAQPVKIHFFSSIFCMKHLRRERL